MFAQIRTFIRGQQPGTHTSSIPLLEKKKKKGKNTKESSKKGRKIRIFRAKLSFDEGETKKVTIPFHKIKKQKILYLRLGGSAGVHYIAVVEETSFATSLPPRLRVMYVYSYYVRFF